MEWDLLKKMEADVMYYPNYMDLPKDIYSRMVHLAESYDVLRKRRQEIENEILYAHSSLQFIARG